jgi:hypothetical protein
MAHVYPLRSVDMIQILRVHASRRYDWWDQQDYIEATFSELLADPLIRQLMKSDGVDPGELRALFADLNTRLALDEVSPGV